MTKTIVVAMAKNRVIGRDNKLLWHLPADLRHLKEITTGHTIIMGRKTYDSVGKPLPKRRNIIITGKDIGITGCEVAHSLEEAIALCETETEVFILGGAEIYKQAMYLTDRIYLTIIHRDFDGDSYFPEIDKREWKEVLQEDHPADEKNNIPYSFITLERIS